MVRAPHSLERSLDRLQSITIAYTVYLPAPYPPQSLLHTIAPHCLPLSHSHTVISDPYVSAFPCFNRIEMSPELWRILRFLCDEILCKQHSTGAVQRERGRERALARGGLKHLEKTLRQQASSFQNSVGSAQTTCWTGMTPCPQKGALPRCDWSTVFTLDQLLGRMTVCLMVVCVSVYVLTVLSEEVFWTGVSSPTHQHGGQLDGWEQL